MQEETVPGTIFLVDLGRDHDTGNHADIVLHPQPSNDPEDPLNWSKRRKLWNAAIIYIYILGVGLSTTVQYSILTNISDETGISLADLNTGTGLLFLFAGWGCVVWQPFAMMYGRRGVYILSSLFLIAPMAWTAYTRSAGEWHIRMILTGAFAAPIESLPELSISDIFFAHERGNFIGIYALFLFGSNALAPMLAGFIANSMGWQAANWFGTIVLGVCLVIVFFGMEETMYFRSVINGDETDEATRAAEDNDTAKSPKMATSTPPRKSSEIGVSELSASTPQSYIQRLRLFRSVEGVSSLSKTFKMMYRPLLMAFYFPNVLWAGFLYGSSLCLYLVANATISLILSSEPYSFNQSMVGLSYLATIIGSVFGWAWAGWVGDRVALRLARRNGGIREPEQRLWILLMQAIISSIGLILWGVGAARSWHFMVLLVGLTMISFGVVCGGATSVAYCVDCFKEIAGESLILVMVIRNTMGFGMGYGITPWIEASGLQNTFIGTAFLSLGCTMSFVLLVWGGKRLRAAAGPKYREFTQTLVVSH